MESTKSVFLLEASAFALAAASASFFMCAFALLVTVPRMHSAQQISKLDVETGRIKSYH
jgi:hypothetical protein